MLGELRPLAAALAYSNERVVWKFRETYRVSDELAHELFAETRRWLWVRALALHEHDAGVIDEPIEFVVTPALRFLDEMWHVFLLFTRAYRAFCDEHLGCFIDHEPNVPEQFASAHPADVSARRTQVAARLERQLRYVHDRLGADVVRRWYVHYLRAYPEHAIAAVHKYAGATALPAAR